LRIAFTELGFRSKCKTWFRQKCRLLPDKDCFHFVYAKYDPGYLSEVCHFVTQEVATGKSVQTHPTQKLQNLSRFGQYYLKELFKKSATGAADLLKAF